jgi:hypothetical protein
LVIGAILSFPLIESTESPLKRAEVLPKQRQLQADSSRECWRHTDSDDAANQSIAFLNRHGSIPRPRLPFLDHNGVDVRRWRDMMNLQMKNGGA